VREDDPRYRGREELEYYIHFYNTDRRCDNWFYESDLKDEPATVDPEVETLKR